MFTIAFAALMSVATAVAPSSAVSSVSYESQRIHLSADDSATTVLERARSAEAAGDLDTALREYRCAMRLQRTDGVLPVAASYGAAHVLSRQAKLRDAATVLEELAADANLLGDANTEAQVLLDVVSLKVTDHRRAAARNDALRLKELVTDVRVTSDTRRQIKARLA